MAGPIRLLHFSDPHLDEGLVEVGVAELASKRALGIANLVLRRRRHFSGAREKVEALARFADERGVEFTLCTGDYTAVGTEGELRFARRALSPLLERSLGYATVPGNHDLYVDDAPGLFESLFEDGLASDLDGFRWSDGRPYVRFVGDAIAIVGLGSARPNPVHSSSGAVPDAHLEALSSVLAHEALRSRFVFVAVHYAPRLWNGRPDTVLHGLDNQAALLDAVAGLRFGALVFGHVHHGYVVRVPGVTPPLVGAGSATYAGRESALSWSIGDGVAEARRLAFRDGRWVEAPEPELVLRRSP